jgi:type I restriction enzyme S subunit
MTQPTRRQNWSTQKVKYVADLKSGDAITSEDINEDGKYPVYGGNGIRGYTSSYNCNGDHPLIGRQGALCGNINFASGKFWASEHAVVVYPKNNHYARWLGLILQSMDLNRYSQSAAQPGISVEIIENLTIPVPPRDEQEIISAHLTKETSRLDRLIAEKERMLALLEEKRAALISRVVTQGLNPDAPLKDSGHEWLGMIPAHWDTPQLKRTWASSDYGLSESIRDEGDIAVLRMSCIIDGRIDISKSGMITEADESLLLRRNDLVFNRTNSLDQIAKVGLVDFDPEEPLTFASYLVRLRTNHLALPEYLNTLLNSTQFLLFARKNAIPAIGQANLSPSRYGEIHIPLPPITEQEEIVSFLRRETDRVTPVRENIFKSIRLLSERRAALISSAVNGQTTIERRSHDD